MHVEKVLATPNSNPFGTATVEGTEQCRLLSEYGYVEEEYFVSGTANVYGPVSSQPIALEPLSVVVRPDIPYKTRALVIRPREASRFSGIVHAIPFHNLIAQASVEQNFLRHGDAWVGVEVCSGTRFGPEEIPSGGVANLHRFDPGRYGDLTVSGGEPGDWAQLTPGALGKAFETINFGKESPAMEVFTQELYRSYGQGPDIFFDVARGLRSREDSVLPGFEVRRIYTSGSSGASLVLRPLIEYHHDRNMLAHGGPPVNGYLIMVGNVPTNRPSEAVLAILQSEAEAKRQVSVSAELPQDSDDPRFRYYEIPGTGHSISAIPPTASDRGLTEVLPPGIQGLNQRDMSQEYEPYDKFNAPIIWALWDAMYRWVDEGVAMPHVEPITRDPDAPDGIARDQHGNALGGLRTPWVDVPDATYVARISEGNPLRAGMKRFTDEQMKTLYGSREEYERRVRAKLEDMTRERWLLPEDAELMFASAG
jgi:hypothetical protein